MPNTICKPFVKARLPMQFKGQKAVIGCKWMRLGRTCCRALCYCVPAWLTDFRRQKHAMSCDRKFWCHAHAKAKASAGHAHTTKALAVPPALAAMGYEPANGGWQLRPGKSSFGSCAHCPPTNVLTFWTQQTPGISTRNRPRRAANWCISTPVAKRDSWLGVAFRVFWPLITPQTRSADVESTRVVRRIHEILGRVFFISATNRSVARLVCHDWVVAEVRANRSSAGIVFCPCCVM